MCQGLVLSQRCGRDRFATVLLASRPRPSLRNFEGVSVKGSSGKLMYGWRSPGAKYLLLGVVAFLLTGLCLWLQLGIATTAFVYLPLVVLTSAVLNLYASVALSLTATSCLAFFFALPSFTSWSESRSDIALVVAFLAFALLTAVTSENFRRRTAEVAGAGRALEPALMQSRQAEKELRAAIDTIPAIVWTTLPDGANDFHNERLLAYTRYAREQLKGSGWTAMFHPDDVPGHMNAWNVAVEAGSSFEFESRLRRFDGEYRWFLARAEPLRNEQGAIVKWCGTNIDIDDRKRAEKALRRSEVYLAEAQRLSHTGSFGWTPSTGEIHWSDESFRIFEYDPSVRPTIELVLQRIHPDDHAKMRQLIDEASRGEKDFDVTHRLSMLDGSVKFVHVLSRALRDAAGNLEIVGALRDVTAAKRAADTLRDNEQRLTQAQAELSHVMRIATLGELTASITHEVNQPLGAIVADGGAALQWLAKQTPDITEARTAIEEIIRAANRASAVISHTRDLCKKAELQTIRLDINALINDTILLVRREAISERVLLQVELAAGLPAVRGDRVQLQQVIINLVKNGIDAMAAVAETPRSLLIRSELDDADQVTVAVRDLGCGVEPETADRLFDPFFTTKPDGMGMGLSICRTIIKAHGGRLWATRNDGPGMTFHFTLAPVKEGRAS
jgi:PAS domain S-box-containing protein